MCSALAHLPIENVDDGWPYNNEMPTKFYDYFVTQWLEHSSIIKEMETIIVTNTEWITP